MSNITMEIHFHSTNHLVSIGLTCSQFLKSQIEHSLLQLLSVNRPYLQSVLNPSFTGWNYFTRITPNILHKYMQILHFLLHTIYIYICSSQFVPVTQKTYLYAMIFVIFTLHFSLFWSPSLWSCTIQICIMQTSKYLLHNTE